MEENLSIDEQIVPFKGRISLKQYNPQKPHKWGYKIYFISGSSGFAYNFEIYSGKENNVLLDGERDCGASAISLLDLPDRFQATSTINCILIITSQIQKFKYFLLREGYILLALFEATGWLTAQ